MMAGKIETGQCDACKRTGVRVENMVRGGMPMKVCVEFRACRAAQPPDLLTRPL